ncbi:MAG: PEP/pyruvate-binding domain-containing protein, partial [Pseudomonadota bacterium]
MTGVVTMDAADIGEAGGKARALAVLKAEGFEVPPFFILTDRAFDGHCLTEVAAAALEPALTKLGPGPFAVRSSAQAEDGATDSHAGQFETKLSVATADIAAAAAEVRASGLSDRVTAYRGARAIDGTDLPAVIVQTMVDARAAGVAFSADPVRGLRGRTVISAVAGLGEALVSGAVDGET